MLDQVTLYSDETAGEQKRKNYLRGGEYGGKAEIIMTRLSEISEV